MADVVLIVVAFAVLGAGVGLGFTVAFTARPRRRKRPPPRIHRTTQVIHLSGIRKRLDARLHLERDPKDAA